MKTFEKRIRVTADDLDDLMHVNNVRYVQWIQDISKEHWQTVVPPSLQETVVWVVRNHNIDYRSAAVLGDEILIKTHISDTQGPLSIRTVEMYQGQTGRLLVRSNTQWCLLNAQTLRPQRISTEIQTLFV